MPLGGLASTISLITVSWQNALVSAVGGPALVQALANVCFFLKINLLAPAYSPNSIPPPFTRPTQVRAESHPWQLHLVPETTAAPKRCGDPVKMPSSVSSRKEALDMAVTPISLPAGILKWISPLVSIIPA